LKDLKSRFELSSIPHPTLFLIKKMSIKPRLIREYIRYYFYLKFTFKIIRQFKLVTHPWIMVFQTLKDYVLAKNLVCMNSAGKSLVLYLPMILLQSFVTFAALWSAQNFSLPVRWKEMFDWVKFPTIKFNGKKY